MKTSTNLEIIEAALTDLQDVMDYIASENGDCNILRWLGPVEDRLITVINRYKPEEIKK